MAACIDILNFKKNIKARDHQCDPNSQYDYDHQYDPDNDISQTSIDGDMENSSFISDDEIKDSKDEKINTKLPNVSRSPVAKRTRLQTQSAVSSETFRKSESFDRPEFLKWLESNEHLRIIQGGRSNICEILDAVRKENSGLNKIFLAFANNGEVVNPHFSDIASLVRTGDSIIRPPKWNNRRDSAATYVFSFNIPSKDVERYCNEIENDIFDHPYDHGEASADYRSAIVAQFRNYVERELPLNKGAKVFRWLYVGQTQQNPAVRRWLQYYKKKMSQRTLSFAMVTSIERRVPHRLVVVSSGGSLNMEAVVAALLNIRIDIAGKTANAINRVVCGFNMTQRTFVGDEHSRALSKYNPNIEMIQCDHCKQEIHHQGGSN